MKKWKKIALIVGGLLVVGIGVLVGVRQARKDVVTVQTGTVTRQDLTSVVTASGEIKPKTYSNILGEGFGKIVELAVREGEQVKAGAVLLRLENIQPTADVEAQRAALGSAEAAVKSAEASYRSLQAEVTQRKADFERAQFDWERGQKLYKDELISKQEYDARKAAFESAEIGRAHV